MCGIFFYKGVFYTLEQLMPHVMKTSHRGPDSTFLRSVGKDAFMGFHRLAIVGLDRDGDQPFGSDDQYAMCNGEIYNHKTIRQKLKIPINSKSDCAVVLPLYQKFGIINMMKYLDGDFAFVIYDTKLDQIHLGRDPMGVKPLFYCHKKSGELFVASEMKSLIGLVGNDKIHMLQSGTTWTLDLATNIVSTSRYWNPRYGMEADHEFYRYCGPEFPISDKEENDSPHTLINLHTTLRDKLTLAVKKRLMSDRPLGLLISGGLDSSLIAGITKELTGDRIKDIESFSIGMIGSPDTEHAQQVADYLGTKHHTVRFTTEEGIAAVREVIRHLESYDITTIRASVPQYLLSRYIRNNTDVKVVLSGEGSDELFGGYLYSHLAPSNDDLQLDSKRLMEELEVYDVLRTDRTTAGNGLEVRVPFLDRGFMKYVMAMPARYKNPNESSGFGKRIEKKILRDAFAEKKLIPEHVLYRVKNAFSDACGYDWIPSLQAYCNKVIKDEEFSGRAERYPHVTPQTKEAYFYRKTFDEFYPNNDHILSHFWLPNWMENKGEPSAKILNLV